jgi:hypothetical protein
MDRRDSLKTLGITVVSAGILVESCKSKGNEAAVNASLISETGRQDFEIERNEKLKNEKFFTDHEMATITILGDIIIPQDERSGSASDAKVPEFIEFIVKDIPTHQIPIRGGLRWLDMQCFKRYNTSFKDATKEQQVEMVSDIAFPEDVKPGMEPGVAFFNRMRDLTATGFYTSEMGVKDLGYVGNTPNKWEGVPKDVLTQYGLEHV